MTNHKDNQSTPAVPLRGAGRPAQRASAGRRLTVRSDQRESPDVRKIALAILAMTRRDDVAQAGTDE